jgi:peptidylprolyl isomerase
MNFKLSSIVVLAAATTIAAAQTKPATPPPAAAPAATPAAAPAVPMPKVDGTPQVLFAIKYIDIVVGTGPVSEARKFYTVKYSGWLTDGTKFDSSYDHPGAEPITFPYGAHQVITGWDTGFEGMHVGGKRRIFVPYQLAYGEFGRPPVIPAKADLIFDVELVSQSDTPPQQPAAPAESGSAPTGDSSAPASSGSGTSTQPKQ